MLLMLTANDIHTWKPIRDGKGRLAVTETVQNTSTRRADQTDA